MDPIPAFSKSAATGLSITAVCKNAGKKTPGQDDFFVVSKTKGEEGEQGPICYNTNQIN